MAKEVHILGARGILVGSTAPGDSDADAACRQFLLDTMLANRGGIAGKSKPDFWEECEQRFAVSSRSFARIWDECIRSTGAKAFKKRGPRGPQKNPRRRS